MKLLCRLLIVLVVLLIGTLCFAGDLRSTYDAKIISKVASFAPGKETVIITYEVTIKECLETAHFVCLYAKETAGGLFLMGNVEMEPMKGLRKGDKIKFTAEIPKQVNEIYTHWDLVIVDGKRCLNV